MKIPANATQPIVALILNLKQRSIVYYSAKKEYKIYLYGRSKYNLSNMTKTSLLIPAFIRKYPFIQEYQRDTTFTFSCVNVTINRNFMSLKQNEILFAT